MNTRKTKVIKDEIRKSIERIGDNFKQIKIVEILDAKQKNDFKHMEHLRIKIELPKKAVAEKNHKMYEKTEKRFYNDKVWYWFDFYRYLDLSFLAMYSDMETLWKGKIYSTVE